MTINIERKTIEAAIFAATSISLGAAGQLFMKVGMKALGHLSELSTDILLNNIPALLWVFTGLACYALAVVSWLPVLARLPLSIAYPLLSLGYPVVYAAAVLWDRLHETPNTTRTIGIVIIMFGVWLTSRQKKTP